MRSSGCCTCSSSSRTSARSSSPPTRRQLSVCCASSLQPRVTCGRAGGTHGSTAASRCRLSTTYSRSCHATGCAPSRPASRRSPRGTASHTSRRTLAKPSPSACASSAASPSSLPRSTRWAEDLRWCPSRCPPLSPATPSTCSWWYSRCGACACALCHDALSCHDVRCDPPAPVLPLWGCAVCVHSVSYVHSQALVWTIYLRYLDVSRHI
mmetsp:Transcript_13556/g.40649  ORF Transcript_13556/g.40649 Transcript_13556/m.40649 type:complete len:210 (+) Transcript_13556:2524-3153(+)